MRRLQIFSGRSWGRIAMEDCVAYWLSYVVLDSVSYGGKAAVAWWSGNVLVCWLWLGDEREHSYQVSSMFNERVSKLSEHFDANGLCGGKIRCTWWNEMKATYSIGYKWLWSWSYADVLRVNWIRKNNGLKQIWRLLCRWHGSWWQTGNGCIFLNAVILASLASEISEGCKVGRHDEIWGRSGRNSSKQSTCKCSAGGIVV